MAVRILGARIDRIPRTVVLVTAGAWALAIGAEVAGHGGAFGHDALIEGGLPLPAALALFVLSWQVMLAAMMLPSSVGMLRAFGRLADREPDPARSKAAFVAAYAFVWTEFGFVAFAGDGVLHRAVDASPWLSAHEWLIGGGVLLVAGAFQFSSLKDRCLTECRTPVGFLMERYRPGVRAAFRVGVSHGVSCVGCCWALMLVGFAAGAGNLLWMAVLTTVMVVERSTSRGRAVVRPVGVALVALAALVLLHPSWLPPVLGPG
jgi:predicted metal-binding membrane protein